MLQSPAIFLQQSISGKQRRNGLRQLVKNPDTVYGIITLMNLTWGF